MANENIAKEVAIWASLVVQELRIDTAHGEWDQLDKLEHALQVFNAKIGTTLTGMPAGSYRGTQSCRLDGCPNNAVSGLETCGQHSPPVEAAQTKNPPRGWA